MYGGATTIGGGTAAATLAYTGANLTWPIIIVIAALSVGILLLVRERLVSRNARQA